MPPKVRGRQIASPGPAAEGEVTSQASGSGDGGARVDRREHGSDGGGTGEPPTKHRTRGSSEPRSSIQQTPQQQEQRFGKRGSGQAFALGLFQILKTEDPKVIGWSASGKAFRIGDSEKFCKDIMPRFFKQNKYSSFQRQLNLYGFRKLVRGNEAGGYMHPLFERGKPEQLSQVRRGFFPEIPPEFAHDVHGHGLNEPSGGDGTGGTSASSSRAAPRGRKSEGARPSAGTAPGPVAGSSSAVSGERSSSVGRSGRPDMSPAVAAAAAAVAAVSMPRNSGHVRTSSGPVLIGQPGHGTNVGGGGDRMAMDTTWDGPTHGRLPSLDLVTGGLRKLPGGRSAGGSLQGAGAEMPPTLGRLVPSADNVVSRETSPMKPGGGNGRNHSSSANVSQLGARSDNGHPVLYGRSQDDLNLTPRSHFHVPIMGMEHSSFGENWPSNGAADSFYHAQLNGVQGTDFLASNVNGSRSLAQRSPRALHHMHSRDDLDALRPRKTRRTGPSYNGDSRTDAKHSFLAASPRRDGDGAEQLFIGEGYLNYAGPDEVPPAAPGRLVSRHNTPSRPERAGAKSDSISGTSSAMTDVGSRGGGHMMNLTDHNLMDIEGTPAGVAGGMAVRNGHQLAANGFYAAMSPVTVAPGRTSGFPGGRRHQRHGSSGTQHSSGGGSSTADGGYFRPPHGWRPGEVPPEEAANLRGDSPSSSRSGGSVAGGGGGGGIGGLGLTAHAMSRMEQVKANQRVNGMGGTGHGVPGVQALGENLSQLDLSEASRKAMSRQQVGGDKDHGGQGGSQQSRHAQHHHSHQRHLPQPNYTQPLRDNPASGNGGMLKRPVSGGSKGGSADWAAGGSGRRPTAAEAAELLRRRSSVDEVIGLLSAPTTDNGFEDEGARMQSCDPAQFDSWRNSLTKVLGHLGFDFEDEQGASQGPEGKRSPANRAASRGTSQYLSWGGTSAMSFEEQPEEFHESLRQIPMRWRSSLSSIMTSMASNGAAWEDNHGGTHGGSGEGGGGAMDVDVSGDGKGGDAGGERKRLEQQASLEMIQSVMRETLEIMSGGQDQAGTDGGEEEAKAAAAAALAMGSMCRAKANGDGNGNGHGTSNGIGNTNGTPGVGGSGRGGSLAIMGSDGNRHGARIFPDSTSSAAPVSVGVQHERGSSRTTADASYYMQKGVAGGGVQYGLASTSASRGGATGGGNRFDHEHTTTF